MFRTSNPALRSSIFEKEHAVDVSDTMTVQGAAIKTGFLLVLLVAAAAYIWSSFIAARGSVAGLEQAKIIEASGTAFASISVWMFGGLIIGFILALVTIFVPGVSMFTTPVYAICEGLFLGGLSSYMEVIYPGIVMQAVGITFGVLLVLLAAYSTGLVKVTNKFRLGVIAATGAIALIYFVSIIFSFFGIRFPFINDAGPIGILFSLFVVVIASLNLVLDFDFIERAAASGAKKYMEWYAAFGLLVTLVWLYIEILRLLSKLRSRR